MSIDENEFKIGTTLGGMTLLSALATPVEWPKSTYMPYADVQTLISGLVRGVGFPIATWSWEVITRPQRDMLRTFCPGSSANVYIHTKTMDFSDSYDDFAAVMIWPTLEEEHDSQRRINFKIDFRFLVPA
jgi:hypothetical protein